MYVQCIRAPLLRHMLVCSVMCHLYEGIVYVSEVYGHLPVVDTVRSVTLYEMVLKDVLSSQFTVVFSRGN